jgi:hypothetical protein
MQKPFTYAVNFTDGSEKDIVADNVNSAADLASRLSNKEISSIYMKPDITTVELQQAIDLFSTNFTGRGGLPANNRAMLFIFETVIDHIGGDHLNKIIKLFHDKHRDNTVNLYEELETLKEGR